jgi:hypothetical protein
MASLKNTIINDTGNLTLPVGTNAQRPTAANGMLRYNTDVGQMEAYVNSAWVTISTSYTIEFVLVAGGGAGGGGNNGGGGGGGGGVQIISGFLVTPGTEYSIVIGGGGASVIGETAIGTKGVNSTGFGYTSSGGGGGNRNGGGSDAQCNGGSGGGGGRDASFGGANYSAGTGIAGQGNWGGQAYGTFYGAAGGGGGAAGSGMVGGRDDSARATPFSEGGPGALINWTGTNIYYGPGGGGCWQTSGGAGAAPGGRGLGDGSGYGGVGSAPLDPTAGTANRGAGGGGARTGSTYNSGAGGSGRCVLRYYGAQRGSGGTVTSSGGYTIHTFDSSGTFTA